MRFGFCLAASSAAFVAIASPAAAQVAASPVAQARGVLVRPLTLVKVDDLDFGTIISGPTAGTVTIDAVSGARTTTGGATPVLGKDGGRATFVGAGTASQTIAVVSLVAPAALTYTVSVGPSTTTYSIPVVNLTLDGAATRTISNGNAFNLGVGGTISLFADQPEGLYSATFDVTVDYQ
jgi:Domain of unknown function (DUF4402)